ncbi:M56 family metallopeptidase, partial [Verrucomicrobiota bacterium]
MMIFIEKTEPFLCWLMRTSWQTSILICLVFLAQWILRKKLSPGWRYGLWMLVLVRMLLPVTPESAWSVFNLREAPVIKDLAGLFVYKPQAIAKTSLPPEPARGPAEFTKPAMLQEKQDTSIAVKTGLGKHTHWAMRDILALVWLAVVGVLLARLGIQNYRFLWRVSRQRPVTDQSVLNLLEDCKDEMGVHVPMNVVETPRVNSPSLLGFIRPRLLLPVGMVNNFSSQQLRYVFLHELTHFKRGDIPINWLMSFLHIFHWFNPFVWIAFSRMRADREAACDGLVLSVVEETDANKDYGEAIISLLEFSARSHWLPGVVGIVEDKNQMKRRITMIAE